jgi:hypothetical protein
MCAPIQREASMDSAARALLAGLVPLEQSRPFARVKVVTAMQRHVVPSTRRSMTAFFAALAASIALLTASCASSSSPPTAPAALPTAAPSSAATTTTNSGVCAHDTVAATFQTAYDGTQPLCRGFAGDADHAGEGLAGAQTTTPVTSVVQWMLLHARAIYSFEPTPAWQAVSPHIRDVNGYFHRQSHPASGDNTKMRAYKDFMTPAPGQPGNEHEYALVSVIVSPGTQAEPTQNAVGGGVWLIGCLVYHADGKEYLETCPSWVWSVPLVPAVNKRL